MAVGRLQILADHWLEIPVSCHADLPREQLTTEQLDSIRKSKQESKRERERKEDRRQSLCVT